MKWSIVITMVGVLMMNMAWPTTAMPPATLIMIEDGAPYFAPAKATVATGSPILWSNPTPTDHTVTHNGCIEDGNPCLFDSGMIAPGEQFSVPGLPPGRYPYHCRIHPIMRGTLTVTDSAAMPSQL
ncbi:MAG: cupredoxin domain-containing protein [Nitrospira sp.]